MIADNPGRFNREASEAFQKLNSGGKDQLLHEIQSEVPSRPLTKKEVLHRGEKIFKRIQLSLVMFNNCSTLSVS